MSRSSKKGQNRGNGRKPESRFGEVMKLLAAITTAMGTTIVAAKAMESLVGTIVDAIEKVRTF